MVKKGKTISVTYIDCTI